MRFSFLAAMGVLIGSVNMLAGFKNVRLNRLCPAANLLFVVLLLMSFVTGSHLNLFSRDCNSRTATLPPILHPLVQAPLVFIMFIVFIVRIQILNLPIGTEFVIVFVVLRVIIGWLIANLIFAAGFVTSWAIFLRLIPFFLALVSPR
jgi:hypothetical protein